MDAEHQNDKKLIETTDCLEAVGVFRMWKNGLFIVMLLGLLMLQFGFWLVTADVVKPDDYQPPQAEPESYAKVVVEEKAPEPAVQPDTNDANALAGAVTSAQPNKPGETNEPVVVKIVEEKKTPDGGFFIKESHFTAGVRFVNFILIPVAILYCLALLFTLKVSMLGRLGGINHIARAFFVSLAMVVFFLPWQKYFPNIVSGMMYSPDELLQGHKALADGGLLGHLYYYIRFTVYWLFIFVLLILSQVRSSRWSSASLRRLEIV